VLVGTAFVAGACIGDKSTAVTVVNDSAIEVSFYPYGRDYPDWKRTLAAGASFSTNWLVGGDDSVVARVEAFDGAGGRVFCHAYTYGELKKLAGKVRIVADPASCG
jgi:hypothetical protein